MCLNKLKGVHKYINWSAVIERKFKYILMQDQRDCTVSRIYRAACYQHISNHLSSNPCLDYSTDQKPHPPPPKLSNNDICTFNQETCRSPNPSCRGTNEGCRHVPVLPSLMHLHCYGANSAPGGGMAAHNIVVAREMPTWCGKSQRGYFSQLYEKVCPRDHVDSGLQKGNTRLHLGVR